MKIGILIKDFKKLKNWELRIIDEILKNPKHEISLLIQDGRKGKSDQKSLKNRIKRIFQSRNVIGRLLFKLQTIIESKLFPEPPFTVDRDGIIKKLKTIDVVNVNPTRKGFLDIFSATDTDKIEKYQLDIILRHEFNIIRGNILNVAKYGIWSFHHGDNSVNRGGPTGFWEILEKHEAVGVTLQQLTPELDGGLIIDKAYFNRHWSFVKTKQMLFEASVSLLIKNIDKLEQDSYTAEKSLVYFNPLYRVPSVYCTIKYMIYFYKALVNKFIQKLDYKVFGSRYGCWTLFVGKGDFLNATLFRLNPIKLPKSEFWADPFLIHFGGDTYVFFENYEYNKKKAKISCARIENNLLVDVKDVLDLDYHLSYPFIFEEDGEIFLMPETNENKRLEIYKCIDFPTRWELYSTAFEDEQVADAFFYDDEKKQKWLFINKKRVSYNDMANELYIYKVDSIKLENIESHKQNPVVIDSRTARNGGAIFEYENEIYRPSQANIDGIYGRGLNINKIKKLTLEEYSEETVVTVKPNFKDGLISTHHLHQVGNMFVIDAAFKKYNQGS